MALRPRPTRPRCGRGAPHPPARQHGRWRSGRGQGDQADDVAHLEAQQPGAPTTPQKRRPTTAAKRSGPAPPLAATTWKTIVNVSTAGDRHRIARHVVGDPERHGHVRAGPVPKDLVGHRLVGGPDGADVNWSSAASIHEPSDDPPRRGRRRPAGASVRGWIGSTHPSGVRRPHRTRSARHSDVRPGARHEEGRLAASEMPARARSPADARDLLPTPPSSPSAPAQK